ncbi:MAG: hypothetical protein CMP14_07825 [Rickettsiales bacterium]|nr:hypothetical protein [Rickettsiales bacterium]
MLFSDFQFSFESIRSSTKENLPKQLLSVEKSPLIHSMNRFKQNLSQFTETGENNYRNVVIWLIYAIELPAQTAENSDKIKKCKI